MMATALENPSPERGEAGVETGAAGLGGIGAVTSPEERVGGTGAGTGAGTGVLCSETGKGQGGLTSHFSGQYLKESRLSIYY